jgi:ribonuclease BN (tRNA processing enzyme)
MRIKVLGCSGAELRGHHLPSFFLDDQILFDTGSVTNVLDEKSQLRIKGIFITHAHLDHIKGVPFLADNIMIGNRRHTVKVFGISSVIRVMRKNLLNSRVWPDFVSKGILKLIEVRTGQATRINGYTISPVRVKHSVPATGYLVEDKKGKRLFYTGDTGPMVETWEEVGKERIHCLIIEVTFPNRMEEMAIKTGHLTPRLLKKELLKIGYYPEKICITHLKPQYFKIIETELNRLKINNLRLLRDGETITV